MGLPRRAAHGEFRLRSSGFAALAAAGDVKTAADEMIKRANLAALIRFERYGSVLPGEVVGLEPDGSRHVTVFLAAGAVAIAGMAPTVVGSQHTPLQIFRGTWPSSTEARPRRCSGLLA